MSGTVPSYFEVGKGSPVILLMGLGASGASWEPHYSVWARSHRCIAVDNRGAGRTPLGDENLTTALMARDVIALLDDLKIDECDIIGISMGSCIAQKVALERPNRVRRLGLVATWARSDSYTRSVLHTLAAVRETGNQRLFNELLRNLIWTPDWINSHAVEMTNDLDVPFSMTHEAFGQQATACATHDEMDRLRRIAVPTLVTYGDADIFIRPDLSAAVAEAIPGAERVIFPDAGHVHHWEDLDRFNAVFEEWVA